MFVDAEGGTGWAKVSQRPVLYLSEGRKVTFTDGKDIPDLRSVHGFPLCRGKMGSDFRGKIERGITTEPQSSERIRLFFPWKIRMLLRR